MVSPSFSGRRARIFFILAAFFFLDGTDAARAQSSQCRQLESALRQFDRDEDFRQSQNNSQAARQLARDVQNAETQYIRQGCNDDAKAGRVLSAQCQRIGRTVLRLRADYEQVAQSLDSAQAVAWQREAILQEMARFDCASASGSSATFSRQRQSVFDRIFGTTSQDDFTNGNLIDGGDYWGNTGYGTVRTVCVRLSDGYYWPISYATLPDYIGNDALQCQSMCPNTPVELFYYDNPGQEVEQMRNTAGMPYRSLPTAFAYRTDFDESASCALPPQEDGAVTLLSSADGSGRAMLETAQMRFPLPLRDPRGVVPVAAPLTAVSTVEQVEIPFPRPRPAGPDADLARPSDARATAEAQVRIVHFDGKAVRVVGPDTPYAQAGQAGT